MAKRPRKRQRKTHHKVRPDFRQDAPTEVELTAQTIGDLRREVFPNFDHDATDAVSLGVRDELDAELARAVQTLVVEGKIKPAAGTESYDVDRIAKMISAEGVGGTVRDSTQQRLADVERDLRKARSPRAGDPTVPWHAEAVAETLARSVEETQQGLAEAEAAGETYQLPDGRWIRLTAEWMARIAARDPDELYSIHQQLQGAAAQGDQLAANALSLVTNAGVDAGIVRDVHMTVAGDDPELVGAMIDKTSGKLVGAAPNTPASKLPMEEVGRRMGVEVETDERFQGHHKLVTDDLDPRARAVLDKVKAVPQEQAYIELWPDDESYEDAVEMFVGLPGLKISYVGLASLSGQLESCDFKCGIEPGTLRTYVEPKAMHRIVAAWRVHSNDRTVVRAGLMIEDRRGRAKPALHDMLPETWEALRGEGPVIPTGAHISTGGDDRVGFTTMPHDGRIREDDRPVWAGARAFDRVWERCHLWAAFGNRSIDTGEDPLALLAEDGWEPSIRYAGEGLIGYGLSGVAALRKATEVLVEPDQINAMPEFDSLEEATDYAERLRLPFDSVFLDMEGPARSCVTIDTGGGSQLVIRGAHVARLVEGDEESPLAVMPYGSIVNGNSNVDGDHTYNPLGLFLFGAERPPQVYGGDRHPGVWGVSSVLDDGYVHRGLIADPNMVKTPLTGGKTMEGPRGTVWDVQINPDYAEPSRCQAHTVISAELEADYERLAVAVAGLTGGAMAALKALFLMDMSNVEVIDGRAAGQVSRQVARQADRKGQTIALAVHVSTSSKRYMQRGGGMEPGAPGSLEYSHRFRVRGHVKHYPVGTRMADADPRKVKPCPRCGNCRRIWTPPFIKGPDDKPLILKSLVLD